MIGLIPNCPRQMGGIVQYPMGDEVLVYLPNKAIGASLNCSAREIWDLCDGTHTPSDIALALGSRLDLSQDESVMRELVKDVWGVLYELRDLGVIDLSQVPSAELSGAAAQGR